MRRAPDAMLSLVSAQAFSASQRDSAGARLVVVEHEGNESRGRQRRLPCWTVSLCKAMRLIRVHQRRFSMVSPMDLPPRQQAHLKLLLSASSSPCP